MIKKTELGFLRTVHRITHVAIVLILLINTTGCGDPIENSGNKLYNIVLISVDTLRADRLGVYGYDAVETPNIDRLANEGVIFENAFTPCPITLPAHASLLTATYPTSHHVRNNGIFKARPALTTLAEVLKANGYETHAVLGALVLEAAYGLDQGFDEYNDDIRARGDQVTNFWEIPERSAGQVTQLAIDYLNRPKQKPFFLFLHYFDPHSLYAPPKPFAAQYARSPYDGEVAYVDQQIGVLLDALQRSELKEDTVVIFTSDHGESLGEHNESSHGIFVYDSTLHVPMIFNNPSLFPSRKQVDAQVSIVDVMPTVLDLLNLSRPKDAGPAQGKSLVPLMAGKTATVHDMLYFETLMPYFDFGWAGLRGIRTEQFKYISAPQPELYTMADESTGGSNRESNSESTGGSNSDSTVDSTSKSRELTNIITRDPRTAEALNTALFQWIAENSFDEAGANAKTMSPEDQARLTALGYSSGAEHTRIEGDPFTGRDPKSMMWITEEVKRATAMFYNGDYGGALRLCRSLLEEDPNNANILDHLASFNTDMGRYAEAAAYVDKLLALNPGSEKAQNFKGVILDRQGRYPEAVEAFNKTLAMNSENVEALYNLSTVYGKLGEYEKAEQGLNRIIALKPPSTPKAYACLGVIYASQSDFEKAVTFYLKALEANPNDGDALIGAVKCYFKLEDYKNANRYIARAQRMGIKVPAELLEALKRSR